MKMQQLTIRHLALCRRLRWPHAEGVGQVEKRRSVARAVPGQGWRVWNMKAERFWGEVCRFVPDALLAELNGPKRPEHLARLARALGSGASN